MRTHTLRFFIMALVLGACSTPVKYNDLKNEIDSNLSSYQKQSKSLAGHSSEGENINYYYQDTQLKKIEVTYFSHQGKTIHHYYPIKGELVLYQIEKYSYNSDPRFNKKNVEEYKKKTKPGDWIPQVFDDNKTKKEKFIYQVKNQKVYSSHEVELEEVESQKILREYQRIMNLKSADLLIFQGGQDRAD